MSESTNPNVVGINVLKQNGLDVDELVKELVKKCKAEYELNLACSIKSNPKLFYSYVRGQYKTKTNNIYNQLKGHIGKTHSTLG